MSNLKELARDRARLLAEVALTARQDLSVFREYGPWNLLADLGEGRLFAVLTGPIRQDKDWRVMVDRAFGMAGNAPFPVLLLGFEVPSDAGRYTWVRNDCWPSRLGDASQTHGTLDAAAVDRIVEDVRVWYAGQKRSPARGIKVPDVHSPRDWEKALILNCLLRYAATVGLDQHPGFLWLVREIRELDRHRKESP